MTSSLAVDLRAPPSGVRAAGIRPALRAGPVASGVGSTHASAPRIERSLGCRTRSAPRSPGRRASLILPRGGLIHTIAILELDITNPASPQATGIDGVACTRSSALSIGRAPPKPEPPDPGPSGRAHRPADYAPTAIVRVFVGQIGTNGRFRRRQIKSAGASHVITNLDAAMG